MRKKKKNKTVACVNMHIAISVSVPKPPRSIGLSTPHTNCHSDFILLPWSTLRMWVCGKVIELFKLQYAGATILSRGLDLKCDPLVPQRNEGNLTILP